VFSKILIANRGEIACRVIDTCRRLGIATVAVYSEADADARHVRMADEAHCVGPAPSRESYLRHERILEVAQRCGAQAVHPGYGFLSENEGFAEACAEAGIVFIGPPVAAIRAMGSKAAAKQLMEAADVPLVPGYHGEDQDASLLEREAGRIGYPVLIKATAGGGGKGMRVVERAEDFAAALAGCQREAQASFGDARVLVEKYLVRPRHIEIQVFGDSHGEVISLHERDCSAQRRHQKVVEEAPAPGMTAERRAAMAEAACNAARAVAYVGAGTVEFIVDGNSGDFFFMEMNTRLQVEHPVTEMITGQDLVEWQLRIAAGEALPMRQDEVPLNGHAIEVRVYAEEPEKGFLPSTGPLLHLVPPPASRHVRIETGVETGDVVSPHYDPMLAKLIVWDQTRAGACARMLDALGHFEIVGVGNNLSFLHTLIDSAPFREGQVDTSLIEREGKRWFPPAPSAPEAVLALASWWRARTEVEAAPASSMDRHAPWQAQDGWRLHGGLRRQMQFVDGEQTRSCELQYAAGGVLLIDGQTCDGRLTDDGRLRLRWGSARLDATVVRQDDRLHIFHAGRHWRLRVLDPMREAGTADELGGELVAPMSGKIIKLVATPGKVKKGAPLLVMEAMKMEHTIAAPADGELRTFRCAEGEQVPEGAELVDFEAAS
jgi:3-methylcrotonyl-CoA carboxylase alpha subunit